MRTIVVTGATGTIGRAVIEFLAVEPDVAIRAATRHPRLLCAEVLSQRVTPVEFDWDAPNAIDDIVSGADTVFLLPPGGHHPLPTAGLLLASAVTAGVRHVVFLSTLGADFKPGFAFGRWALAAEQALVEAGVPYTVLRPNSYMTNFLSMLRPGEDGALRLPWGAGASSFVDPRDVAAVAACVLLEPYDHIGATYELTGPEALDANAVAAALHDASGAPIHYVDTPVAKIGDALSDAGMPPSAISAFLELHDVMASGGRSTVTDDVQQVTGRPPRSLRQFAADHAAAWAPHGLAGAPSHRRR